MPGWAEPERFRPGRDGLGRDEPGQAGMGGSKPNEFRRPIMTLLKNYFVEDMKLVQSAHRCSYIWRLIVIFGAKLYDLKAVIARV